MEKKSKKEEDDESDQDIEDKDEEDDSLDFDDLDLDDNILSSDFQDLGGIGLGESKGIKDDQTSSNLLKDAKNLLKKVKIKQSEERKVDKKGIEIQDEDSEKAKRKQKKKQTQEDIDAQAQLKSQYFVTELMVEELGNLGLDISTIKELVTESKKFLDKGDWEAAETLIKNSKIFASNLWLENRINLLSTIISFIDTFIFDFTDLELDFKNPKKYFKQAKVFLNERDLTLANKYIDNTIQNIKKSWDSLRKKKLKESIKYYKVWLQDVEELELDTEKLKTQIMKVKNSIIENEFDIAELTLKKVMDLSVSDIKSLKINTNKKEDYIQGIEAVYDFDNFVAIGEAISKAESMLMESQEKDRIQLQLNSLLTVYSMIHDMENKGLDITKYQDLFETAKEAFEKEDYSSIEIILKKIMGLIKREIAPKSVSEEEDKSEPEKKEIKEKPTKITEGLPADIFKYSKKQIDALPQEKRELYDKIKNLRKKINKIKEIKKTGEEIVNIEEMFEKAILNFNEDKISPSMEIVIQTEEIIKTLKGEVLKIKAENTIESTKAMIAEANELGINVIEADQTLDSADELLKGQEFQSAIDLALESQQVIENLREQHQNASDKLFKIKLSMDKVLKDQKKPPELEKLISIAKQALKENEYEQQIVITNFIIKQLKKIQNGEDIDKEGAKELLTAAISISDLGKAIKNIEPSETDKSEVEKIHKNALNSFKKQKFDNAIILCDEGMSLIGGVAEATIETENDEAKVEKLQKDLSNIMNKIKKLVKDGVDVSKLQEHIEKFEELIQNNDLENARSLVNQINQSISTLDEHRDLKESDIAKTLIEKLKSKIKDAKKNNVFTKEAEDLFNYAKQRMKSENYTDVIDILEHSNNILEKAINETLKRKADEYLWTSSKILTELSDEHPRKFELKDLWKTAKSEFDNKEFEKSLNLIVKFLTINEEVKETRGIDYGPEGVSKESVSEEEDIGEVAEAEAETEAKTELDTTGETKAPDKVDEDELEGKLQLDTDFEIEGSEEELEIPEEPGEELKPDEEIIEEPEIEEPETEEELPEEPVDELPEEPVDELPEEPVDELPGEPIDELHEEPEDELPEEPVDELPEEPVDELPGEPVDELPEEPIDEQPEEPVDELPEEPVDELLEEPVDELPEEPADELPEEPVDELPEEPEDELPEEPADELPEEPVDELPEEPEDELPEEPEDELPEEPVDELPEEPVDELPEELEPEQIEELEPELEPEPEFDAEPGAKDGLKEEINYSEVEKEMTRSRRSKQKTRARFGSMSSDALIKKAFGFVEKDLDRHADLESASVEGEEELQDFDEMDRAAQSQEQQEMEVTEEKQKSSRSSKTRYREPSAIEASKREQRSGRPKTKAQRPPGRMVEDERLIDREEITDEISLRDRDGYPEYDEADDYNNMDEEQEEELFELEQSDQQELRREQGFRQPQRGARSRDDEYFSGGSGGPRQEQYRKSSYTGRRRQTTQDRRITPSRTPTVTIDRYSGRSRDQFIGVKDDFRMDDLNRRLGIDEPDILEGDTRGAQHKKRLSSLKKEALKGLQDIQGIISATYHFGAQVDELERLSEDARNAYDDGDYQEVLLYVDKCEELSRRLKVAYMDSLISEIKYAGENTDYPEYLIDEIENAYNEEKYKIGDELCRRFMKVITESKTEPQGTRPSRKYCKYCGNSLSQDSAFCSKCGERLS